MSKTTFSDKCQILGSLWTFYKETDNESWKEFFAWADLGCPLAYFSWQGLATLKPEAKSLVENTWGVFCDMIDIDPEGSYADLTAAFAASPNKPLEN